MLSANRPRIGTIGNHQIQSSLIGCSIFCLNQMLSLRIISHAISLCKHLFDCLAVKFSCRDKKPENSRFIRWSPAQFIASASFPFPLSQLTYGLPFSRTNCCSQALFICQIMTWNAPVCFLFSFLFFLPVFLFSLPVSLFFRTDLLFFLPLLHRRILNSADSPAAFLQNLPSGSP